MTGGWQKLRDRLYVLLLGAAIAALAWIWQYDTPPPDLMDDLAAAAGLRPPAEPLSLLWQVVAAPLCRTFGLAAAETVLRILGHVSLGILAVLSVALFRMMLPVSLYRGEHVASWWRVVVRFVLFQGVVIFCCSEPVWDAFRWFSPLSLQILLTAVAAALLIAHMKTDGRAKLLGALFALGLLSADTPVGAVLLAAAVIVLGVRRFMRKDMFVVAMGRVPFSVTLMAWCGTFAFAFGALAGAALEIGAFKHLDGLAAFGWSWGDYAFEMPIIYIKKLLSTCSLFGVAMFVILAVFPVVVELQLINRATDEERHLAYIHGMMFFVFGIVAFSQLASARAFWFWTWPGGGGCVRDGILKCIAMYLCALSFVWALAVFMIELYMRNFRRIKALECQDPCDADGVAEAFALAQKMQRVVRALFFIEPLVVIGCVLPFRSQSLERAMLGVVADAAQETVEECRGAEYVFTDGGLDAAVELASARSGQRLRALSMMGGAAAPREMYLRTRGVTNAEDRALLESGAADALRTWVRSRPDKAGTYAVQIGFELWRRDGKPMPECSGLVARSAGFAPGEVERGVAKGRELARRLLALYDNGNPDGIIDSSLRDAFLFAQWRLAVIARHRANAYDERRSMALAMADTRLADTLDSKNGAIDRIRATMAWASRRKLERMTPQEGLKLGLSRANFALARVFALRVLDISPDDPAANFALGMDFFVQKQYARAQAYLERCLKRRPDDPAVLNNLAQCRLRQDDPDGALPYAERARETLPDSPEIKRTLERIKSAIDAKRKHADK